MNRALMARGRHYTCTQVRLAGRGGRCTKTNARPPKQPGTDVKVVELGGFEPPSASLPRAVLHV